jgi:Na+-translocating ferredoxin:NAD+ oxidoreductase RNF subunit RnfB
MQEIVGTLLHYARAIDAILLVALGPLASAQAQGTEATAKAVTQLLNYCATHPDAVIRYHASDMCLLIHSDASYRSGCTACSRLCKVLSLAVTVRSQCRDVFENLAYRSMTQTPPRRVCPLSCQHPGTSLLLCT